MNENEPPMGGYVPIGEVRTRWMRPVARYPNPESIEQRHRQLQVESSVVGLPWECVARSLEAPCGNPVHSKQRSSLAVKYSLSFSIYTASSTGMRELYVPSDRCVGSSAILNASLQGTSEKSTILGL